MFCVVFLNIGTFYQILTFCKVLHYLPQIKKTVHLLPCVIQPLYPLTVKAQRKRTKKDPSPSQGGTHQGKTPLLWGPIRPALPSPPSGIRVTNLRVQDVSYPRAHASAAVGGPSREHPPRVALPRHPRSRLLGALRSLAASVCARGRPGGFFIHKIPTRWPPG